MRVHYKSGWIRHLLLPLVLCSMHPTVAQAQPIDGPEAVNEKLVYASGHVWLGVGLSSPIQSIATDTAGNTLALTQDGKVFMKTKAPSWREVLGASGLRLEDATDVDDEDLLMDVEGFIEEAEEIGGRSEEGDDVDDDDADEEDKRSVPDDDGLSVDEFDSVDMYATDAGMQDFGSAPSSGRIVWHSEVDPGLALVARGDGVWRSDDGGYTWAPSGRIDPVHAFTDGPNGLLLAGTTNGVRFSRDQGRTWRSFKDPMAQIETFCFARDGDTIYAGTSEGLFRGQNGYQWAKVLSRYDSDVPVWAIAIDRYWENGMWIVGPVGILRSDSGGEQLRSAGQNTLIGTVTILPLDQPGHLLAGGVDGVWESTDGGLRWRPIANGLPSPASRLLTHSPLGPIVAGSDGVFRLQVTEPEKPSESKAVVVKDAPGTEMPTVVHVAISRPGMAMSEILSSNVVASSLLLPKLTVSGRLDRSRTIQADYDAEANTGSSRRSWSIGITACFGSCGASMGYSDVGDGSAYDGGSDAVNADAVAVVGGEVYGSTETGSIAPMAANVAERGTRYRTDVASRVSELILARHRLLEARSVIASLSLREQVGHELDILESAARLDVYTNGYYSRALEGS